MSGSAIQVSNLSKAYRLGRKEEVPDSLIGAVTGMIRAPWDNWRRLRRLNTFHMVTAEASRDGANGAGQASSSAMAIPWKPDRDSDVLWSLRDVSFDINAGDVVGIIGGNGAGKSTLLKILSRITEPTSGRAVLRGRISSLLEVGTGFHPDLTGRENVYMNGTILGMTKGEVDRKFDEIVDFSGVELFLDTPVKRFSSGMLVRLAFAVAAHLEPEILIVDEVLAVGDLTFQKKCIGRMSEIAKEQRTILFVSHNMSAIRSLCSRGIVLDHGRLTVDASIEDAISQYTGAAAAQIDLAEVGLGNRLNRTSGEVRYTSIRIEDEEGGECLKFSAGSTVRIRLKCKAFKTVPDLGFLVQIWSDKSNSQLTSLKGVLSTDEVIAGTESEFVLTLPSIPFRPDDYKLYVCLGTRTCQRFYDVVDDNVALPRLSITADIVDPQLLVGHVSIPWSLDVELSQD